MDVSVPGKPSNGPLQILTLAGHVSIRGREEMVSGHVRLVVRDGVYDVPLSGRTGGGCRSPGFGSLSLFSGEERKPQEVATDLGRRAIIRGGSTEGGDWDLAGCIKERRGAASYSSRIRSWVEIVSRRSAEMSLKCPARGRVASSNSSS